MYKRTSKEKKNNNQTAFDGYLDSKILEERRVYLPKCFGELEKRFDPKIPECGNTIYARANS